MKLRPSQFTIGDVLHFKCSDDVMVIGKQFVRGGVRIEVRNRNGSEESYTLNGRCKFDVTLRSEERHSTQPYTNDGTCETCGASLEYDGDGYGGDLVDEWGSTRCLMTNINTNTSKETNAS